MINTLERHIKNPLITKVFREMRWVEELGSGKMNIKKYAPLYYNKFKIDILNAEKFVFSITYRDVVEDKVGGVNTELVGENVETVGVSAGTVGLNDKTVGINLLIEALTG